jgi:hypothetical protein
MTDRVHTAVRRSVAIVGLVLACAVAGGQGVRTTHDLQWPPGPDLSRDMAAAESIRSGHLFADPAYDGEWLWYNPLVPAIVAGVSIVAGQPTHTVYARLGAYANLIAPLALFALVAALFDAWVALFAVTAFLFLVPGREPAWLCATYSPWLMPVHFVQGLFYLALLAMWHAWRKDTTRAWAVAGMLAGLVFLGHTAPALILGGVVAIGAAAGVARKALASFILTAAIVSAPYLAIILGVYHGAVRNMAPSGWFPPELSLEALPAFLSGLFSLSAVGAIAAVGLVLLIVRVRQRESLFLLAAGAAVLLWFAYSYVVLYARQHDVALPAIVPSFHFLYYLRAFEAIGFGLGVAAAAEGSIRVAGLVRPWPIASIRTAMYVLACGAMLLAVSSHLDAYKARPDFVEERAGALQHFTGPGLLSVYQFIRSSTAPSDVFLVGNSMGLSVICVAGRKVVALDKFFSNPFVDWAPRSRDRDEMQRRLEQGDWDAFAALAFRYRVRYAITRGPLPSESKLTCCVSRVWQAQDWFVYRVAPPSTP